MTVPRIRKYPSKPHTRPLGASEAGNLAGRRAKGKGAEQERAECIGMNVFQGKPGAIWETDSIPRQVEQISLPVNSSRMVTWEGTRKPEFPEIAQAREREVDLHHPRQQHPAEDQLQHGSGRSGA